MLLTFPNGDPFATGAAIYRYQMDDSDTSARIVLYVQVEGNLLSAIVDTGAPYFVCSVELAKQLALSPTVALSAQKMMIRGNMIKGYIHRLNLNIPASEGKDFSLEATAFVPDIEDNYGANFPCFLGMLGCLEWVRFAVDPFTNLFYFGSMN